MQAQNNIAQARLVSEKRNRVNSTTADLAADNESEHSYDSTRGHGLEDEKKFVEFWGGIKRGVEASNLVSGQYSAPEHAKNSRMVKAASVHYWTFHPDHPLKILWDIWLSMLVIYSVILIPYHIGFEIPSTEQEDDVEFLITTCFAMDIGFNFNTAYLDFQTEKLVYQHRKIAKHYFQFWFWTDLFATMPFDTIFSAFITGNLLRPIRLIRILRLLRLVKLYRISKSNKSLHSRINPALISLTTLLFQIFIIAHIFACFWHFIAVSSLSEGYETNWIEFFSYSTQTVSERYMASLYYIIVTMLTVGYGDIRATNQPERVFAIMTMLVGGMVFGALISQMTSLIDRRNPQAKAFKARIDDFNMFLASTGLPIPVRRKAKAAFAYYLNKKSAFSESGILEELSPLLLKELVREVYHDAINSSELLSGEIDANPSFVVTLIKNSRPFEVLPGEIIIAEGDICNDIFFVKHGTVCFEPFKMPTRKKLGTMTRMRSMLGGFDVVDAVSSRGSAKADRDRTSGSSPDDDGYADLGGDDPTSKKSNIVGFITERNIFGDAEMFKNTTSLVTYRAVSHCHLFAVSHKVIKNALQESSHMTAGFDHFIADRYKTLLQIIHQKPEKPSRGSLRRTDQRSSFSSPYRTGSIASMGLDMRAKEIWVDGAKVLPSAVEGRVNFDENLDRHRIRVYDKLEASSSLKVQDKPHAVLHDRHLLDPTGPKKLAWDFFVGFLILYSVLIVPVEIGFNEAAFEGAEVVDIIITCFFFIDIVLSFFTAYQSADVDALVIHPPLIVQHYLSTWFFIDFFSTVPFDQIVGAAATSEANLSFTKLLKVLRLVRLLKLARMLKLGAYLELVEESLGLSPAIFQLCSLLFQVFFIAHLIACLWFGLGASFPSVDHFPYLSPWYKQTSMFGAPIAGKRLIAKYLVSIYYSFTTITTVGYGDVVPQSAYERGLAICIVLVGASMFGYTLANVSAALNNVSGSNSATKEQLAEIIEYLNEKGCSPNLANRVFGHFQRKLDEISYDLTKVTNCLPPRLATQVLYAVHLRRMSKIPLFRYLNKKTVAVYLFNYLQPSFLDEGDYIVKEGSPIDALHFLVSGEAVAFRRLPGVLLPSSAHAVSATRRVSILAGHNKKAAEKRKSLQHQSGDAASSTGSASAVKEGKELHIDTQHDNSSKPDGRKSITSAGRTPFPVNSGSDQVTGSGKGNKRRTTIFNFASLKTDEDELFRDCDKPFATLKAEDFTDLKLMLIGPLIPGEFIGHNDFMQKTGQHRYSAKTTMSSIVYILSKNDMNRLIRLEPTVGAQLQAALVQAIRAQTNILGKKHRRYERALFLKQLRDTFTKQTKRTHKLTSSQRTNSLKSSGSGSGSSVGGSSHGSNRSDGSSEPAPVGHARSSSHLLTERNMDYDSDDESRNHANQMFKTASLMGGRPVTVGTPARLHLPRYPSSEPPTGQIMRRLSRQNSLLSNRYDALPPVLIPDRPVEPRSWLKAFTERLGRVKEVFFGKPIASTSSKRRSCSFSDFENHCLQELHAKAHIKRRQSFPALDNYRGKKPPGKSVKH